MRRHKRLLSSAALTILVSSVAGFQLFATGFWMPSSVLQEGARHVMATPEFFWEFELRRIAREFAVEEKRIAAPLSEKADVENADYTGRVEFTAKMDREDFAAAIKAGHVKPADAAKAIQQHEAARLAIDAGNEATTDALPAEFPSEFADYHKGAFAFKTGKPLEATEAWKMLLARPATERKHRSVWAAFMLGKQVLREMKYGEAVPYFQQARALAKEGFSDSLSLAAESYGWEALCELESGNASQAAKLYLTQMALGDSSAVTSLKLLVPDRQAAVYSEVRDAEADATTKAAYGVQTVEEALAKAAADPVLRRLVTAHVLAVGVASTWENDVEKPDPERQARWLAAIEKAAVKAPADAEHLGWVAYSMGRYADAARWLKLSSGESNAALWLKAKLALREGKLSESAALYSQAVRSLPDNENLDNSLIFGDEMMPSMSAYGDLGTVLLARSEFIQALDAFLAAGLWDDAAYVAERCLTKKELLDYTARHYPEPNKPISDEEFDKLAPVQVPAHERRGGFRDMVARRLVRESDYKTARTFFPPDMQKVLDDYTAALADGANEKSSKRERARALFHAAWVARHMGMELMGTETGPDSSSDGGMFSAGSLAMVRLTGKTHAIEDPDEWEDATPKPVKFSLSVTAEEKKRLTATKLNPERRYHYRHVAAGLAWKAALLLPDGAEETADVLNCAGNWLKARKNQAADRFYQAIERRCSKTKIGKEAVAVHWFTTISGPWSDEEKAREDAEKKEP